MPKLSGDDTTSLMKRLDAEEHERLARLTGSETKREIVKLLLCGDPSHHGAMIWNPNEGGKGKTLRRRIHDRCFIGLEDLVSTEKETYVPS